MENQFAIEMPDIRLGNACRHWNFGKPRVDYPEILLPMNFERLNISNIINLPMNFKNKNTKETVQANEKV